MADTKIEWLDFEFKPSDRLRPLSWQSQPIISWQHLPLWFQLPRSMPKPSWAIDKPEFKVRTDYAYRPIRYPRGHRITDNFEPGPKRRRKRKSKGIRKHIRRQKAKQRKAGL